MNSPTNLSTQTPDIVGRSKRVWILDDGTCVVEMIPRLRSHTFERLSQTSYPAGYALAQPFEVIVKNRAVGSTQHGDPADKDLFRAGARSDRVQAALPSLRERNGAIVLINPGAIANEDDDDSLTKLSTASVGKGVRWVLDAPADAPIGEIEL